MALKKSDLYATLWKSCNELRGGSLLLPALHKDKIPTYTGNINYLRAPSFTA